MNALRYLLQKHDNNWSSISSCKTVKSDGLMNVFKTSPKANIRIVENRHLDASNKNHWTIQDEDESFATHQRVTDNGQRGIYINYLFY